MSKLLKIPDDLHDTLKEIQSYLYLRYKKILSQRDIIIHYSHSDANKSASEIADRIYKESENSIIKNK